MDDNRTRIALALANQQAQAPQPASPFQFNPALEQQAAPANIPMNPIVQQLVQHLGLLNMIRNQSNEKMIDPMVNQ